MSRFLSSFRRLNRKIRALETQHGDGDFPLALATFNQTGALPENTWLRAQVELIYAGYQAMADTMPKPPEPV